jgi:glutamine amidotransferase
MANLRSVEKALERVGAEPVVTADPAVVASADRVVLPGVGAFCAAMNNLKASGLQDAVVHHIHAGKPFLGICLGLQMLFEESDEMGHAAGLGLLPGRVAGFFENGRPAGAEELKVPHIGWNELHFPRPTRIFEGIPEGVHVYFVHSFYPDAASADFCAATCDYGEPFCCAVEKDNIMATQFHPEKSGDVGLSILRNFTTL